MGLCARFRWLPSQAMREDWATLAELQERLLKEAKEQEFKNWQNQQRQKWA